MLKFLDGLKLLMDNILGNVVGPMCNIRSEGQLLVSSNDNSQSSATEDAEIPVCRDKSFDSSPPSLACQYRTKDVSLDHLSICKVNCVSCIVSLSANNNSVSNFEARRV